MQTPRFVRFCRALAMVSAPVVAASPLAIPLFVEGCSSSSFVAGGCSCFRDGDAGYDFDTGDVAFDLGDTLPTADDSDSEPSEAGLDDADALDTSEAGDGGPGAPPDLPFFACVRA